MPGTAILHEVEKIYGVSYRFYSLAKQQILVSEALTAISGSIHNIATSPGTGCDEKCPIAGIRSRKYLIRSSPFGRGLWDCGALRSAVLLAARLSRQVVDQM
jgi:hypothetical protein